jgi:urease accessory protein
MLIFTHRLESGPLELNPDSSDASQADLALDPALDLALELTLELTAAERSRSRHRFEHPSGPIFLQLPRGTLLREGDRLQTETQDTTLKIQAKAEPVLTVRASTPLQLLQAAYHLGNRHVPLEITADYLRLEPDPVLEAMLQQLGLSLTSEITPFDPIPGAYHHP